LHFLDPSLRIELHVFFNASEMAFASVAYWRIASDGQIDIRFIAGKSKCAP